MIRRIAPAVNQIRTISIFSLIIQFANIVLSFVLIKYYFLGAIGSSIAVCCSIVIGYLFLILPVAMVIVQFSIFEWIKKTFLPGVLPAILAGIVWLVIFQYHNSNLTGMAFGAFGAIPIYFLLCFLCMNNRDKAMLAQIVHFAVHRIKTVNDERK